MHSTRSRFLKIQEKCNILGISQQDFVIIIARAKALFELVYNLDGLLLGFPGTPTIEWFVFMPSAF
jgi:hypothetical protein